VKRRRNPASSSMVPLLLVGAGAVALYASRRSTGVSGIGDLGFSFGGAVRKISHTVSATTQAIKKPINQFGIKDVALTAAGGGIVEAAKMGKTTFKALPGSVKALATGGVTAMGVRAVVVKVMKGKRSPAPAPGSKVEYQDENGNVITKAEYDRRQALYEAQSKCAAKGWDWNGRACVIHSPKTSAPLTSDPSSGTSYTDIVDPNAGQAAQPTSTGGGPSPSASDYYNGGGNAPSDPSIMPPIDATPAPTSADAASPPAPAKKLSPFVAVATFAAVPLLLGLTGEH